MLIAALEHLAQPLRHFKDAKGFRRSIDLSERPDTPSANEIRSTSAAARLSSSWYSATDENDAGLTSTGRATARLQSTIDWVIATRTLFAIIESHNEISVGTAYCPVQLMKNSKRICEASKRENDPETQVIFSAQIFFVANGSIARSCASDHFRGRQFLIH